MRFRSLVASLLLCLVSGLAHSTPAVPSEPDLESVVILRVDGTLVLSPEGEVVHYLISTKLSDELRRRLLLTVGTWKFKPVLIDGVAREVRADMRVMLAARPMADRYRIEVDNVLFPGKGGIVPDGAKAIVGAITGRRLSPPQYPRGLAAANIRGVVLLAIRVSPDGTAEEVAVTQSMLVDVRGRDRVMKQALRAFESASKSAAIDWTFNISPELARKPGTERTVTVPIDFAGNEWRPPEVGADGRWHTFVRGPKRPISWQPNEAGAQRVGVTDVSQGEVIPLISAIALTSDVVGAPLL